jgi:hypothetical protein
MFTKHKHNFTLLINESMAFRNENGDFLWAVGKRNGLRLEPFDCELFAIKTGFGVWCRERMEVDGGGDGLLGRCQDYECIS